MKKVAIQKDLSNVKDYLIKKGYNVFEVDSNKEWSGNYIPQCDAVVVSGMSNDVMGIETTDVKVPVIEASGLTPDEIYTAIENKTR